MSDMATKFREELLEENATEAAATVTEKAHRALAESLTVAAEVQRQITNQFKGGFGMLPATQQLFSIGHIVRELQIAPHAVRAIAYDKGIMPTFTIDSTPYWDGAAYVAIVNALKEQK